MERRVRCRLPKLRRGCQAKANRFCVWWHRPRENLLRRGCARAWFHLRSGRHGENLARLGNFDVFEERADHRAEQRIFFGGPPGDERDPAARLQDTAHFPESFVNVRNEHDAEAASHAIEMAIGEWKLLGVRGLEFDVADTPGCGDLLGHLQHLADEISGHDSALRTDSDCEGERRLAGTTGEIEDVHAGSESRAIHDKFGGATRLMGELCVPFSPERSGGDPFLADGFAGIARSKRVPGHDSTLKGATRFNELYVNWVSVSEFLGRPAAIKSFLLVRHFVFIAAGSSNCFASRFQ